MQGNCWLHEDEAARQQVVDDHDLPQKPQRKRCSARVRAGAYGPEATEQLLIDRREDRRVLRS